MSFKKVIVLNLFLIGIFSMVSIVGWTQPFLPQSYSSTMPVNFVRTWEAQAPITDPSLMAGKPLKEVKQSTQYLDGLGRPIQTVVKQGSIITGSSAVDLVQAIFYDAYGRESLQYLPFAANTADGSSSVNNGNFKSINPFQQQQYFYSQSNTNSPIIDQSETYYYSKTDFESSPLNRPIKTYAPGNSWVGGPNGGVGVNSNYWFNTADDDVRKWTVTNNATIGQFGTYSSPGEYEPNTLYKNIVKDEHGKQIIEFKDKEGRIVLKKVQLTALEDAGTGRSHDGWLCTYYLYDDLGQLRAVVQPVGVDWLKSNSWNIGEAYLLSEQVFRYEYDSRGRLIIKKVPGASPIYMVYDKWNRLVLTQDGVQRADKKWLYTKYDHLNRPIVTGIYEHGSVIDQLAMQSVLNTANLGRFESFSAGASQPQYSLNQTFPNVTTGTVLSANYYDTYDWTNNLNSSYKNINTTWNADLSSQNIASYPEPITQSFNTTGFLTGIWYNTQTYSSYIYDPKGRIIQTNSKNITGGTDIITNLYCFNGSVGISVLRQEIGNNSQRHEVWTRSTYDELWRVTKVEKRLKSTLVNSNLPGSWKTTIEYTYNALGQVKTKNLGTKSTGGSLVKTDQQYNIRGWLLSINKKFVTGTDNNDRYFGMELGYDKAGSQSFGPAKLNGNIAGTIWKSKGDEIVRKYLYSYDVANRFLKADFSDGATAMNFNVSMGNGSDPNQAYDYNGNIKKMKHTGWHAGTSSKVIDDLSYVQEISSSTLVGSNRLVSVTDAITTDHKLGDFFDKNTIGNDYTYDLNGNLKTDKNKSISNIVYNHLNLPITITIKNADGTTDKGLITYAYQPDGTKLSKVVTEYGVVTRHNGVDYTGTVTTTTKYLTGSLYESKNYAAISTLNYNDKLLFLQHEDGRIRYEVATSSTCPTQVNRFVFDYYVKDHLGNIRSVLTEQSENICYPGATLETTTLLSEKQLFTIVDARIKDKSIVNGAASYPQFGNKLYEVNGGLTNQKTGLGIVLKVMAGDIVKFKVQSIYTLPAGGNTTAPLSVGLTELLSGLAGSTLSSGKGVTQSILETLNPSSSLTAFNNLRTGSNNRPQAYLNYMCFDDQFKYTLGGVAPVASGSGTTPAFKEINDFFTVPIAIQKNGYIYIFVSNESNLPVYFDNLLITHTPGPILEETHFYPFGLVMSGISSKALNNIQSNKYKFNGIEQNKDMGLNIYDAFYRNLDPQIGRFLQIDPVTSYYESTYIAMGNNPIRNTDWLGNYYIWGSQAARDRYDRMRNENSKNIAGYMNELLGLDLNSSDKKVQSQIAELKTLINMHGELNSQWNAMDESGIEFYVTDEAPRKKGAGGSIGFHDGKVIISLGDDNKKSDKTAHEFRHAYSYINGEMMSGNLLNDITDEVVAYNAGFLFLDRSTASLVAKGYYDVNWFKNTYLNTDLYKHLTGKEVSLTTNTLASIVIQYNPDARISHLLGINKNNANLTTKEAMDILNSFSNRNPPEYQYQDLLIRKK